MRPNSLFVEEDFLPELEQKTEKYMSLWVEYRSALTFYVNSSTTLDQYKVSHDFDMCINCTCIGNAEYHRRCMHMKRGNVVLRRRKERLARSEVQPKVETSTPDVVLSASKVEQGSLNGNRPFSLYR